MNYSKMKKYYKIFTYIIFVIIFTIIAFEVIIRFHPIYEKFGFKNKYPLFDRYELIDNSETKINNLIIGDSLVEYMLNQDTNFIELTKKNLEQQKIFENYYNFGFAGTGPRHYLMILDYILNKKAKIDNVYIFIDNSTDFSDYFFDIESNKNYTVNWKMPDLINLDEENVNIKNFIKKSVTLNIIYRYIFKQYFKVGYGKSFETNLQSLQNIFNINEKEVVKRINEIDDKLIHLSKSDIINSYWAAGGIVFPEMKMYEKYGYEIHKEKIQNLISKDFNEISKLCEKFKINCSIIFIPDHTYIDKKYHYLYEAFGYKLDDSFLNGTNYYEDFIVNELSKTNLNFHKLFGKIYSDQNMYLYLDNHFNYHGNIKMAEAFTQILLKKY